MSGLVVTNHTTTWHDGGVAVRRPNGQIIALASERVGNRHKHGWDSRPAYTYLRARLPDEGFGGQLDGFRDVSQGLEQDGHHLYHAASSFYYSGFASSAVLVADSQGPSGGGLSCTTIWRAGRVGELELLDDLHPSSGVFADRSIGHFYTAIGALAGMQGLFAEGRTMALASYGQPSPFLEHIRGRVELMADGRYDLDPQLTRGILAHTFGPKFYGWGEPRREDRVVWDRLQSLRRSPPGSWPTRDDMDIAYAGQRTLEQIMLGLARRARALSGERRLCIAGGVGLNCVANEAIRLAGIFDEVFVAPAPGDDGQALGKLFLVLVAQGIPLPVLPSAYLGLSYGHAEIMAAVQQCGTDVDYVVAGSAAEIVHRVARLLADGLVVGWFHGRSEFGPRALGNRSILADPRYARMRDRLNQIKGREWFRPVAPVVLAHRMRDYFVHGCASPLMSFAVEAGPAAAAAIPAALHVDNTARVQTIAPGDNALLYELVSEFERLTSVPVLLNTSFNGPGEPIVETPLDALRTFLQRGLDVLAMGRVIVRRASSAGGATRI